jgi:hypothetical protein
VTWPLIAGIAEREGEVLLRNGWINTHASVEELLGGGVAMQRLDKHARISRGTVGSGVFSFVRLIASYYE